MLEGINNLGVPSRVAGPAPQATGGVVPKFEVPAAAAEDGGFPPVPPPEVLASLDKAARVIDELSARRMNLHFAVDDKTKKIEVEVRDGNGKLVRYIPTSKALDVLAGDVSALAFDARG